MARTFRNFAADLASETQEGGKQSKQTRLTPTDPIVKLWILRCIVRDDLVRSRNLSRSSQNRLFKALAINIKHAPSPDFDPPDLKTLSIFHRKLVRELNSLEANAGSIAVAEPLHANATKLSKLLGLSELDQRILEFAVYAHNNSTLKLFDFRFDDNEGLAKVIANALDVTVEDVLTCIKSNGKLLKTGLITVETPPFRSLTTALELYTPSFAERITMPDVTSFDILRGRVDISPPTTLALADYAHIQPALDILLPFLQQAIKAQKPGVNILIYGQPGTGKTEFCRLIAATLNINLFEVSSEDDDGDFISGNERWLSYCLAQNLFRDQTALITFDEAEDVFGSGGMAAFSSLFGLSGKLDSKDVSKAWVNKKLEDNKLPAFWISNSIDGVDPAYVRRFDMVFELPIPPKRQRLSILQNVCQDTIGAKDLERFANLKDLAPAIAARSASVIRTIGTAMPDANKANAFQFLVENTLQAQGHHNLNAESPLPGFYDPAFINANADLAAVAEGLKVSTSARLCLFGPPGTGKTGYGRWLAEYLDKPLLIKKASDLMSPYVGGNEQNIARAFREASDENAVLMIDEVDSFLQDRQNSQRSWEVTLVNEMLTQIESFNGIFIASTNLMDGLDPAALRRFDIKVMFDYLQPAQATALALRHCAHINLPPLTPDELNALSQIGFLTPGDFAAAARQHRFRPYTAALDLIKVLSAECKLKKGTHPAIGFCH